MNSANFRIGEDILLSHYDLDETTDERLLSLAFDFEKNPFLPLQHPPSHGQAMIKLLKEVHVLRGPYPRTFEAVVTDVSLLSLPLDHRVIVEIYDPYSYGDHPVSRADDAFLHTAACYKKLEALQGDVIPKYLGSFIIRLRHFYDDGTEPNYVACIIREHIDGTLLNELNMKNYTTEKRQEIMEKVIEAEKKVDEGEVSMGDGLSPQGFILVENGQSLRVVPWLFSLSGLDPDDEQIFYCPGSIPSTILKWTEFLLVRNYFFGEFVDWPWTPWLYEKYWEDESRLYSYLESDNLDDDNYGRDRHDW